jgi:uracil-DNA glycosylase
MTLQEVQVNLYERLKPSGWGAKLKTFLLSQDFLDILEYLYKESREGRNFTPVLKELFRAFEECPYDNLKVVIIGQDPYPGINVADGILFSCSHTQKEETHLQQLFDEIERTVYPEALPTDEDYVHRNDYNPDLKRWSNQGVLLLPTALTCKINVLGEHQELWKPFITYLFDILNAYNTGIIYVYLGAKSMSWHNHIESSRNYKFFTMYPSDASYTKQHPWDSGDLFNQINKVLMKNNGVKIIW